MHDPIITLIKLNAITLDLNQTQDWIDNARVVCSTNQQVQLELDRHQTEVDTKRKLISQMMADIRNRN